MQLSLDQYKEKVLGCWMGKNIGGTLGAPFEARTQLNDVSFYIQDLKGIPPANDDLDLQLVWLNAAERYGKALNARLLGEYWLNFIIPHWVEYGAGATNMKMGIEPPISGYLNNPYRDSNGCYIRSEIWACLAPGHPEIAVKYAYQDGIIDHSTEGLYGEIFCVAVQSAAFVENDKFKLIDIGLSYIPKDCGIATGINTVLESFKDGKNWQETRKDVLTAVPGSFGAQGTPSHKYPKDIPMGKRGWDAPSNVAITILGWVYGGDEYGKSICIAVNCGEDTDCTGATLGAILGIIHGMSSIPKEWKDPLGDAINTCCINFIDGVIDIPKTVQSLTERVLRLTPTFLGSQYVDVLSKDGYTVDMLEGDKLYNTPVTGGYCALMSDIPWSEKLNSTPVTINHWVSESFDEYLKQSPFAVEYDFAIFNAVFDYEDVPFIHENAPKNFKLILTNNVGQQQWLEINWHLPEGFKVSPAAKTSAYLDHRYMGKTVLEFTLEAECLTERNILLFLK